MACVLLIDMLGIKARWRLPHGRQRVDAAFRWFASTVEQAVADAHAHPSAGGLDSDAAALIFPSVVDAINTATIICDAAFEHSYKQSSSVKTRGPDSRFWLRGVIVSVRNGQIDLVEAGRTASLTTRRPSDALLSALSLEQSGFKGMRLLIERDLVTDVDARAVDVMIGRGKSTTKAAYTHRITRFRYSPYPAWERPLADVAWMLPRSQFSYAEWFKKLGRMQALMRWAASDELEFAQAASTMVGFSEMDTVIRTAGRMGIAVIGFG
jgi:hypothetical protein